MEDLRDRNECEICGRETADSYGTWISSINESVSERTTKKEMLSIHSIVGGSLLDLVLLVL